MPQYPIITVNRDIYSDVDNIHYLIPAYSDIVISALNIPDNILENKVDVKFRITLFIKGSTIATLKTPPIASIDNDAIFRIQSILQDYTQTDTKGYRDDVNNSTHNNSSSKMPHSIHQIDRYSRNASNFLRVSITSGYEYRDDATSNLQVVHNWATGAELNFWNATAQHSLGYLQFSPDTYVLDGITKKFLSTFPAKFTNITGQRVERTHYHTIAFFLGKVYDVYNSTISAQAVESEVSDISVSLFDENFGLISTEIVPQTQANGGARENADLPTGTNSLLYFGCGPANLQNSLTANMNDTNIKHYTIHARNSSGGQVSQAYIFNIVENDCKGFETIRLAFLNRLGVYDYYNFTKKSTRKQELQRSTFKSNYGEVRERPGLFETALYYQGTHAGGTRAYNVNAVETIEANTDFMNEDEAAILEELFLSTDIYMQSNEGDIFEPVVISDTEYIKQTTANDKLIQYVISIEKAHNTRVQRL